MTPAAVTFGRTMELSPGMPDLRPGPGPGPTRLVRPRRYMTVGGTRAPVDDDLAASGVDYERFTSLAGPMTRPPQGEPYRVQYRGIHRSRREWVTTRFIASVLAVVARPPLVPRRLSR